ncbi:MAG: acyl-CoA thioesterase [Bacteroidetes bacterium]|jgi:acyl-CoA thioesterase YciA|nr:acyl-CoA thioesterase [Bacteroidota bacterium]
MELITTHIAMTKDMGVHGNLFGGIMMAWIDEAASVLACQTCHSPNMVTVKIDELVFQKKVKEGFLIKIYGEVAQIGKSSITMTIEARKESVYSQEQDLVLTTKVTFVRIDEGGDPTPIPTPVRERYKHLSKY